MVNPPLGGTGYGRWGRVFLFSKSTPSCDTDTTQNCCPFRYRSIATKNEVTRFLNVPLDVSDVFLMTFMILLDSYMEPTRVGSDIYIWDSVQLNHPYGTFSKFPEQAKEK